VILEGAMGWAYEGGFLDADRTRPLKKVRKKPKKNRSEK
jgi:hypothetical protein